MPRGDRLPHAALRGCLIAFVLLSAGVALAEQDKDRERSGIRDEPHAKQEQAPPSTPLIVGTDSATAKPDPNDYRDPCAEPKTQDDADLCQQWRMAEAAEETADWTFGQVIATGLEAVLLAIAIVIASWAGYWARRAAKAGDRGVDATWDIGMAQTPAYIQVTKVTALLTERAIGAREMIVPTISIEVTNSGNSPALAFRWDVKAVYQYAMSTGELRESKGGTQKLLGENISTTLTASRELFPLVFIQADRNALDRGHLHMCLTISTVFDDVFGEEILAEEHFTARFDGDSIGNEVEMTSTPIGAELNAALQSKSYEDLTASREGKPNS